MYIVLYERGVMYMFKRLKFNYYWAKGEKALAKGDIETAKNYKEKMYICMLEKIRES